MEPLDLENSDISIYVMGGSPTRIDSLDGGSRIFIECARRWVSSGVKIYFFTSEEGYGLLNRYGLKSIKYVIASSSKYRNLGLYGQYVVRMIKQSLNVSKIELSKGRNIIYSGSDFWPDAIPAFIMKMRFKRVKWVAGFYLFASNPLSSEHSLQRQSRLKGINLLSISTACLFFGPQIC